MAKATKSKSAKSFTTKDAARVAGISIDMLNYLCRYGIITPGASTMLGRGRRRKFVFGDLILLRIIARLLEKGVSVLRLRTSLANLQADGRHYVDLLTRRYVATDGADIYVLDKGVWQVLDSRQLTFAFVLELGGVRKEVNSMLRAKKVA